MYRFPVVEGHDERRGPRLGVRKTHAQLEPIEKV
jgi:hypothetical protein